MQVPVRMLAYGKPGEIRVVDIPDHILDESDDIQTVLELVFHFGQNMFQCQPEHPSISVGDVIDIKGRYHVVANLKFREIDAVTLAAYEAIPQYDRHFWDFLE